jgi:hypothetical protein
MPSFICVDELLTPKISSYHDYITKKGITEPKKKGFSNTQGSCASLRYKEEKKYNRSQYPQTQHNSQWHNTVPYTQTTTSHVRY